MSSKFSLSESKLKVWKMTVNAWSMIWGPIHRHLYLFARAQQFRLGALGNGVRYLDTRASCGGSNWWVEECFDAHWGTITRPDDSVQSHWLRAARHWLPIQKLIAIVLTIGVCLATLQSIRHEIPTSKKRPATYTQVCKQCHFGISFWGRCNTKTPEIDYNHVVNASGEHLGEIRLARRTQNAIYVLLIDHRATAWALGFSLKLRT